MRPNRIDAGHFSADVLEFVALLHRCQEEAAARLKVLEDLEFLRNQRPAGN